MKKLVLFSLAALTSVAHAEFEYSGYMRSGNGFTTHGGGLQGFSISGAPGNSGRLGNEVTYGEAVFSHWALRGKEADQPFFKSTLTVQYAPKNKTLASDTDSDLRVIEGYIEEGYIDNMPFTLWAGKRYYRDADIHIDDFHYFADMSGVGAGLGNFKLGFGSLDVAFLQSSSSATNGTSSNVGDVAKQALDFRLKGMMDGKLDLWLAAATIPGSNKAQSQTGEVAGVKFKSALAEGSNTFAVVYGLGAMSDLGMKVDKNSTDLLYSARKSLVKKQNRLRVVNSYEQELNSKWAIQAAVAYEKANNSDTNGVYSSGKGTSWYTVGARPQYYITDNVQWLLDVNHSSMKDETAAKTYKLTRVTTGPQLSLKHGQFARPVIRAFVTRSNWNNDFKGSLGTSNAGFTDKKSATQVGFQGEIWF